MAKKLRLKLYRGFGHTHDLLLFGHVLANRLKKEAPGKKSAIANLLHLLNLFIVKPVGKIPVRITWQGEVIEAVSEADGFFWLEWKAAEKTLAGNYPATVKVSGDTSRHSAAEGEIIVPHLTQYAFISDIDDTVMVSHSATGLKRMRELFFKSPAQRRVFADVATHYQLLAISHTTPEEPNPFFYVSSSEWNLYDYLNTVFTLNRLPHGAFLLSQMKRWYQLFKTGKTKHEAKLLRISRLFVLFPNQHFVLFGDNSQSDPGIYEKLSQKYGHRIGAVYIRNVVAANETDTATILKKIEARNIPVLQFTHSVEAIAHSREVGLITV